MKKNTNFLFLFDSSEAFFGTLFDQVMAIVAELIEN